MASSAPHRAGPLSALVVIPARMASTRLPNKPLADIGGVPMIVRVWRQAVAADIGPVLVACAEQEIADAIHAAGGSAVLTDPNLPSGSDRVHAAATLFDPEGMFDVVVNVQGDLPVIDPAALRAVLAPLADPAVELATLGSLIHSDAERDNPSVVKAVVELPEGGHIGRALYFSRQPVPHGTGPHIHHIGLYAFRRAALERFVSLPPAQLELREKLEQLRALAHGMHIALSLVDTVPLGVDTAADLEQARAVVASRLQQSSEPAS
jgi:3-deoxy-manno-octulosonate cytidylyltransferase (CMP-KDO synthetase)